MTRNTKNINKVIVDAAVELQKEVLELRKLNKELTFAFLDLLDGTPDHHLTDLVGWQKEKVERMAALRREFLDDVKLVNEWQHW